MALYSRLTITFLLLLLFGSQSFFVPGFAAAATTYYVSPAGNDSNPGTSARPFQTIQQGIARALPGDTIIVKPGTYASAEWNASRRDGRGGRSGTATARIVLRAENPATGVSAGQRAILRGNGSGFGLLIDGISYITIDGFEITNFDVGVSMVGNSRDLIFRRNIVRSNVDAGINCAPCSNSVFAYNAFLDPGPPYPDLGDAIQDYALSFYQGSANNTVIHNYFFGKHNQALSWKRQAGPGYAAFNTFEGFMYTAVYLGQNDDEAGQDMTSYDITVECNVFRDAVDRSSGAYYRSRSPIAIRNVQNAVIRANFIENMFGPAIEVIPCERGLCSTVAGKKPVGAEIFGNTIINGKTVDPHTGQPGDPPAFDIVGRGYSNDRINLYNNTIFNTNRAFLIQNTPSHVNPRETSAPPRLIIANNNLVNVRNGVGGNTSTTNFVHNNWYDLNNPAIDNRQRASDTRLAPSMAGPFTQFDPFTFRGPNPVYTPDFSRNQAYRLTAVSLLVDAGVDVGLPFTGSAPDVGSNEFIPTVPLPALASSCEFDQIYLPLIRHG